MVSETGYGIQPRNETLEDLRLYYCFPIRVRTYVQGTTEINSMSRLQALKVDKNRRVVLTCGIFVSCEAFSNSC
jgi:hypothetical protein